MANIWDAIFGSAITANKVLASPNGSAGPLTPRVLVAADLPAGTGTVTSVALATGGGAADALYTVSGSPITTSGTITETLNTQSAARVFAGPVSGSAAAPTFRALAVSDEAFDYGRSITTAAGMNLN